MQQLSGICMIPDHEQRQIIYICMFPDCPLSRPMCSKCVKIENHKHQQKDQFHLLDNKEFYAVIKEKLDKIQDDQLINYNKDANLQTDAIKQIIQEIHDSLQKITNMIDNMESKSEFHYNKQELEKLLLKLKKDGFSHFSDKQLNMFMNIDKQAGDIILQLSDQSNHIIQAVMNIQDWCYSQQINNKAELFVNQIKDSKHRIQTFDQLGGENLIFSSAISTDLNFLVSGGNQKQIKIWNYNNNFLIKQIQLDNWINQVKFTDDSQLLYVGKQYYLYQFNVNNNFKETYKQAIHTQAICNIYCITNTIILTSSYDKTIIKTDINLKQQLLLIKAHNDKIEGLDYNHKLNMIASASFDLTIKLWSGNNGQRILKQYNAHNNNTEINQVLFITNKNQLVSIDNDSIIIWIIRLDIKQLEELQKIKVIGIYNISLIQDCQYMALICRENIKIYSTQGNITQCQRICHLQFNSTAINEGFNHSGEINTINLPSSARYIMNQVNKMIFDSYLCEQTIVFFPLVQSDGSETSSVDIFKFLFIAHFQRMEQILTQAFTYNVQQRLLELKVLIQKNMFLSQLVQSSDNNINVFIIYKTIIMFFHKIHSLLLDLKLIQYIFQSFVASIITAINSILLISYQNIIILIFNIFFIIIFFVDIMQNHQVTIVLYCLLFVFEGGLFAIIQISYRGIYNIFDGYTVFSLKTCAAVICINSIIILIINILKRKRKFQCIWYISSINYILFNASIIWVQFQLIAQIKRQDQELRSELKSLCIIQSVLLAFWQFFLTYMYLQQNGKLNSILAQFGKLRLILIILKIILYIFCLNLIISFDTWEEQYNIELNLQQWITVSVIIYLATIQLQILFRPFGYDRRQFKSLNNVASIYLLFYTFQVFSNDKYISIWMYFLTFIQLNEFVRYSIQSEDAIFQNFSFDFYCYFCKDHITRNEEVIYFQYSQNIFHQKCYLIYKQQTLETDDYYFMIDLQQHRDLIRVEDLTVYGYSFIAIFIFNVVIMVNQEAFYQNIIYSCIQLICLILITTIIILEKCKIKGIFFAKIKFFCIAILFICIFSNYYEQHEVIKLIKLTKFQVDGQDFYYCNFGGQVFLIFEVVLTYLFFINFQGFLLSKIIIIPRKSLVTKQNFIIFHSFILIGIQSIFLQVVWVDITRFIEKTFILCNLTNIILSLYLFRVKKNYLIEILKLEIQFVIRCISSHILFQIIIALIIIISVIYDGLEEVQDRNNEWLIRKILFLLQFFNISYVMYIKWFCFNIIDTFNKNQQERIQNMEEFVIPDMIQIQFQICKYCGKYLQNGETIIYKINCQHSIHKKCMGSWLNYPRCCFIQENHLIEINWN